MIIEMDDILGHREVQRIMANRDPYGTVKEEYDYLREQYISDLRGKFGIASVQDYGDYITVETEDNDKVGSLNSRFAMNLKLVVEDEG